MEPVPKRQRKSKAVRQQEIIDAARKTIIKYGSEKLTVKTIAKEVKITEAAIYRHFKSKREILAFLIDHTTGLMLKEIGYPDSRQVANLEQFGDLFLNHLTAIEQRQGIVFQVLAEIISLGDKRLNQRVCDNLQKYLDHIKTILENARWAGLVRRDLDVEAGATLLFGMIQGVVDLWTLNNYRFNLVEKYKALWPLFHRAIQPEPASAA